LFVNLMILTRVVVASNLVKCCMFLRLIDFLFK